MFEALKYDLIVRRIFRIDYIVQCMVYEDNTVNKSFYTYLARRERQIDVGNAAFVSVWHVVIQ